MLPPVLVTDWWSKNCLEVSSRFPRRTPGLLMTSACNAVTAANASPRDVAAVSLNGGCGGAFTKGHYHAVLHAFRGPRKQASKTSCKPTDGVSRILEVKEL